MTAKCHACGHAILDDYVSPDGDEVLKFCRACTEDGRSTQGESLHRLGRVFVDCSCCEQAQSRDRSTGHEHRRQYDDCEKCYTDVVLVSSF